MFESDIYQEIVNSPKYQRLKKFRQHGKYSVYEHSISVCRACFKIAKRLHLKVDESALIRGALLHDYFLYDWHDKDCPKHHFTKHPALAAKNAKRDYGLSAKEEKIILSHMFPAGLKVPSSKEAWILTIADKYCTVKEVVGGKRKG